MEHSTVHVRAPARLHFGLYSFGGEGRQYGGVGVMVDRPPIELIIRPAKRFGARGALDGRVRQVARCWSRFHGSCEIPPCAVEVLRAPRQHVGLGTGTQLALSVCAGLNAFVGRPAMSAVHLARAAERADRSAVGTYGFLRGGLVVERGKLASDSLSPLDERWSFPPHWRFVLVCPRDRSGLSGAAERQAFASLPAVDRETRDKLIEEVKSRLVPAVRSADFPTFSDSLYRYGFLAGTCFAQCQGGAYNGAILEALVREIRELGVRGVGQSSWGPTLFALVANQADAEMLRQELVRRRPDRPLEITIAPPNNCGAVVSRSDVPTGKPGDVVVG